MKLNIKKLSPDAKLPTYGTEYSAGADLYALTDKDITVPAHETVLISTGLALEIPEGYCGLIFARSGMATKRHLAPANKVGVIDADYRGEVKVALINWGEEDFIVNNGDRVAQMVVCRYEKVELELANELSETERGAGGFGHTGV